MSENNSTVLTLLDGTKLNIPVKIEDDFHVATAEILKMIPVEYRKKLLWYQVYLDWKHSIVRDEQNFLPIHLATINGDSDLVRRQCAVLTSRNISVDIPTYDNTTSLQISIRGNNQICTRILLFFGANPLINDSNYKTCFHIAAEFDFDHLSGIIKYCNINPISILKKNNMWKAKLELKDKKYLSNYLLKKISKMFDINGYTPLMIACKTGKYNNVNFLVKSAPETIDIESPKSGITALILAIKYYSLSSNNIIYKNIINLLINSGANTSIISPSIYRRLSVTA